MPVCAMPAGDWNCIKCGELTDNANRTCDACDEPAAITVGKLKEILAGIPDSTPVMIIDTSGYLSPAISLVQTQGMKISRGSDEGPDAWIRFLDIQDLYLQHLKEHMYDIEAIGNIVYFDGPK